MVRTTGGFVRSWIARAEGVRLLAQSWVAMHSRRMGNRAVLAVGAIASMYAMGLYVTNQIGSSAPEARHDAILKARWSSPAPSPQILIVDVDERSLAALAPAHGRWPWPRSVMADGIQKLSEHGTSAVLLNVLMSDHDKQNPEADAAMEVAAAMLRNTAFPVIRLSAANDGRSSLRVQDLLGPTGDPVTHGTATVAVILPMFEAMRDRIGVANQLPDSDGVVRSYPLTWSDNTLTMPSIVARTAMLAGHSLTGLPHTMALNWRNKNGRYRRISFSDLLNAPAGDPLLQQFKGSLVVLGVSAPGLGQTKGTAVVAVEDDNEILATAVDDAIHRSYLRTLPPLVMLVIELVAIWALVWMAVSGLVGSLLTKSFLLFESTIGGITLLSASYTNYLVDLTPCMAFSAGVFGAIKFVKGLDSGWSRARPGLRRAARVTQRGTVLMMAYKDSEVGPREAGTLQRFLEQQVGISRVIRVDDLFGGENFIRPTCEDFSCQVCLVEPGRGNGIRELLAKLPLSARLQIQELPLQAAWNPDAADFRQELTPQLLRLCADVLEG